MQNLETVTPELIEELRNGFSQRMESEGMKDKFHPRDVKRIKEDNVYVARFLLHHDLDMKEASNMAWDTCKWRKENGANEITAEDVPTALMNKGCVFPHNRDKEEKRLFLFRAKKHAKGSEKIDDLRKLLTYWLERLEREEAHSPITVILDLADTGLTNMDMNFIQLFINMLKFYYPNYINYILVFEMPWIMNAAWKIIKGWLPPKAVARTKFLNKNTMKDYIDPDQQLAAWGGNDDYEYSFTPEEEMSPASTPSDSPKLIGSAPMPNGVVDDGRRKVHFAEGGEPHPTPSDSQQFSPSTGDSGDFQSPSMKSECACETEPEGGYAPDVKLYSSEPFYTAPKSDSLLVTRHILSDGRQPFIQLSPHEELIFSRDSPTSELTGSLSLQNIKPHCVAYKIKTTAPEKYRVHPSLGVLRPRAGVNVAVQIQPGYHAASVVRDKFLVMLLPVDIDTMSQNELRDLWRGASSGTIQQKGEQHRLKCSLAAGDVADVPDGLTGHVEDIKDMLQKMLRNQEQLMKAEVRNMRRDIIFAVGALIIVMIAVVMAIGFWSRGPKPSCSSCEF